MNTTATLLIVITAIMMVFIIITIYSHLIDFSSFLLSDVFILFTPIGPTAYLPLYFAFISKYSGNKWLHKIQF